MNDLSVPRDATYRVKSTTKNLVSRAGERSPACSFVEQRVLHVIPRLAFVRILLKVLPTSLELFFLFGGQRQALRARNDALPDLLDDLDAFQRRKVEDLIDGSTTHAHAF